MNVNALVLGPFQENCYVVTDPSTGATQVLFLQHVLGPDVKIGRPM